MLGRFRRCRVTPIFGTHPVCCWMVPSCLPPPGRLSGRCRRRDSVLIHCTISSSSAIRGIYSNSVTNIREKTFPIGLHRPRIFVGARGWTRHPQKWQVLIDSGGLGNPGSIRCIGVNAPVITQLSIQTPVMFDFSSGRLVIQTGSFRGAGYKNDVKVRIEVFRIVKRCREVENAQREGESARCPGGVHPRKRLRDAERDRCRPERQDAAPTAPVDQPAAPASGKHGPCRAHDEP